MTISRIPGQLDWLSGGSTFEHLVFTSGLISSSARDGGDIDAGQQIAEAMTELERVLVAGGSDLQSVLRLEAFLASADDFEEWNSHYLRIWPSDGPARSTFVTGFARPGILFEIQAIAAREG